MDLWSIYLVAFTVQKDISNGVTTTYRTCTLSIRDQQPSSNDLVNAARQLCEIPDDYRLISSLISPVQPFERQTKCEVAITLMPGNANFAFRLRRLRREYDISDDFTLADAFYQIIADDNSDDSVVGWSYSPKYP